MSDDDSETRDADAGDKLRSASQHFVDYTRGVANDMVDERDSLTEQVVGMMQDRLDRLTTAFGAIARAKTPMDIAQVYTEFLLASMQGNAKQLVELGQAMARANAKAWSPFTAAAKGDGDGRSQGGPAS